MTHRCPIRGHKHDVAVVKSHTQVGTGKKAVTYECPTGVYRWFALLGQPISSLRLKRPRYGWRN